jgi:hypothetical protein
VNKKSTEKDSVNKKSTEKDSVNKKSTEKDSVKKKHRKRIYEHVWPAVKTTTCEQVVKQTARLCTPQKAYMKEGSWQT